MSAPRLSNIRPAVVIDGQAMLGPFQHAVTNVILQRLQEEGRGDQPLHVASGSSSGSLIAAAAAAGGIVDHEFSKNAWIKYGQATQILFERLFPDYQLIQKVLGGETKLTDAARSLWDKTVPHRQALQQIFDQGLIDTQRAFSSRTQLILTASRIGPEGFASVGKDALSAVFSGLSLLFPGSAEQQLSKLIENTSELVRKGSQLVTARYFTNKEVSHPELRRELQVVQNAKQLRAAIEASSRIPLLYGGPLEYEAERLIDGAFSNNAPLNHALLGGATHLFVITGGRQPKVYDRPFQNYARRAAHEFLSVLENTAGAGSFETAQKAFQGLKEVVPPAQPLDLKALERKYGGKIQVIHPGKSCPNFSRFFETRAEVLGALYDHGREQAEAAWEVHRAA